MTNYDGKMLPKRIKNLEKHIIEALEKYPHTRNSDVALTIAVTKMVLPKMMIKGSAQSTLPNERVLQQHFIDTRALYVVREDNVKRIRAKIQNERHEYLPTDEKVRKARRINEEIWEAYCKDIEI